MTELSGTLEGVGLPAIVRFLTGLGKTGRLRIATQQWHGEVHFDHGRVADATLGTRHGISALEALIQALPGAEFAFDADAAPAQAATIDIDQAGLLAHLDEVGAQAASGSPAVPAVDMVPRVVQQGAASDEPLALDRRVLQTLLAIDGTRSVNDILIQRGSIDAIWDLVDLGRAGLIRFEAGPAHADGHRLADRNGASRQSVEQVEPPRLSPTTAASGVAQCPKLGFEDDPSNSFNRPTRLHRCFALGAPLPLTLDQQSELCLTDQFPSCPRFIAGQRGAVAEAGPTTTPPVAPPPTEDESDANGRVVRLPFGGRPPRAPGRAAPMAPEPTQPSPSTEPRRFLRPAPAPREAAPAAETPVAEPRLPVRERMIRPAAASGAVPGPGSPAAPPSPPPTSPRPSPQRAAAAAEPPPPDADLNRGLVFGMPVQLLVMGVVAVLVLAVVAFLLAGPNLGGQPVIQVASGPTPPANAGARVNATLPAEAPPVRPPGAAAPVAAPTTAPAAAPTIAPAQPTVAAQPTPTVASTPSGPQTVFDERFTSNARNWPSDPQGPAVLGNGVYQISTRQAGQFVAIAAPVPNIFDDVIVTARFHKLAGPPGGGYGVIVRDQGPGPRDGRNQSGNYYVAEVGDRGEVGMWRRNEDTWVDLLPWQRSDRARPDTGTNDVSLRAVGNRLTLIVNGGEVASVTDDVLASGAVGVFVGGDGNQAALEQYSVQAP